MSYNKLSPTSPDASDRALLGNLTSRPSKNRRSRTLFETSRNPFRIKRTFQLPAYTPEELRKRRARRLRLTVEGSSLDVPSEIVQEEEEIEEEMSPTVLNDLALSESLFNNNNNNYENLALDGDELNEDLQDENRDILDEPFEGGNGKGFHKQGCCEHIDRLKRAREMKKQQTFLNLPTNVKISRPDYVKSYNRVNKHLMELASLRGAIKRQSVQNNLPRLLSNSERKKHDRNLLALRQIQKLKREAHNQLSDSAKKRRLEMFLPLENNQGNQDETKESEAIDLELKIAIMSICELYQRLKNNRVRSNLIFKNLKESLDSLFNNIYLIKTRFRGYDYRDDLALRRNLASEVIVYLGTSPVFNESVHKLSEILSKVR